MTKADLAGLETTIERAFDERDRISPETRGEVREAIEDALDLLDRGQARVAERQADGTWTVNQWLKKAVLLSFRINPMEIIKGGPGDAAWWDKVPSKFSGWSAVDFEKAGFRVVPSAIVRRSAYVAPGVILMPSFVNLGAHVDSGTMVDTWATVGSCAQIGKNVHLSGGVGIGGVLEPLQAGPTIIEDNCFIGARSEVVEGCIVREGAVLGMGVFIGKSTKIVDRATGEVFYGEVPANSVVVAGTLPGKPLPTGEPGPSLYCAVIVKRVDEKTRSKTSINELLREIDLLAEQIAWVFFSLKGRLSPAAYFLAGLLLFVIQLFFVYRIAMAAPNSAESESWALSFLLLAIVCGWANFAITAKRFHDFGKPTPFAIIAFFIGFILVIVLSFVKGDPGPNRYGASTNAPG